MFGNATKKIVQWLPCKLLSAQLNTQSVLNSALRLKLLLLPLLPLLLLPPPLTMLLLLPLLPRLTTKPPTMLPLALLLPSQLSGVCWYCDISSRL